MNDFRRELDSELASMIDSGDPETSAAIKSLVGKRKTKQLLTDEIRDQSLDFLTAKPDRLKAILTRFPDFCKTCRESGAPRAAEILEAIADRYTRRDYNIDCDTLTFIGIHLDKNGYKQEAIRCYNRAEAIISE